MISLLEVLSFRCLRYIRQPLGRFHVLVGPNASGKTTFLDAIAFVSDFVATGLEDAVSERTQNFQDLCWGRGGSGFEIAIEAPIPRERQALLAEEKQRFDTIRYEVGIGSDPQTGETVITEEQGFLICRSATEPRQRSLFPNPDFPPPLHRRQAAFAELEGFVQQDPRWQ